MPVLLAALVVPVVAWCLARVVVPGRGHTVRREIDAWHVLMGTSMLGMLAGSLSRPLAVASLALAALAVAWGALSVERRSGSGAHVRLLVGASAMAVMTLPLAAPAEAAGASRAPSGMSAMSLGGTPSALLVVLLVGALLVSSAARLPAVVRRSSGAVDRLDACCDFVMAGAMAVMLVTLL
jgi:hypothetical protein